MAIAKKVIDREQEIVFTNWTDKEFKGQWDFARNKKVWILKPGRSYYLPLYLAEHFAKHLIDQYMNEQGLATNHPSRQSLLDRCVDRQSTDKVSIAESRIVPVREVRTKAQERDDANKTRDPGLGTPRPPLEEAPAEEAEEASDNTPKSESDESTFEGADKAPEGSEQK